MDGSMAQMNWRHFEDFLLGMRPDRNRKPGTYKSRTSLTNRNNPMALTHRSTRSNTEDPPQIHGKLLTRYLPTKTGHSTFIVKKTSHLRVPLPADRWKRLKDEFLRLTQNSTTQKLFDFTHSEETFRRFISLLLEPILEENEMDIHNNQLIKGVYVRSKFPDYLILDKNDQKYLGVMETKRPGSLVKTSITQCMQQLLNLHIKERCRKKNGPLFGVVTDALHFIFIKLHSDGQFEFEMDDVDQLKVHKANTWDDLNEITGVINGLCQLCKRSNSKEAPQLLTHEEQGKITASDSQAGTRHRKRHEYKNAPQQSMPTEGADDTNTFPIVHAVNLIAAIRHLVIVSIPLYLYLVLYTLYYYMSFMFQHKCHKNQEKSPLDGAEDQYVSKRNMLVEKAEYQAPKENTTDDAEDLQKNAPRTKSRQVLKGNKSTEGAEYHEGPRGRIPTADVKETTVLPLEYSCLKIKSPSSKTRTTSACREVGNMGTKGYFQAGDAKYQQQAKGNIQTDQQVPQEDVQTESTEDQRVLRTTSQMQVHVAKLQKESLGEKRHRTSNQASNMMCNRTSDRDGTSDMMCSNVYKFHNGASSMMRNNNPKYDDEASSMMWSNTSSPSNEAPSIMWSNTTSHDDEASSVMWNNSPQHNNGASSMVWSNTDQDIGASNMTSNINSKHDDEASSMMWNNSPQHNIGASSMVWSNTSDQNIGASSRMWNITSKYDNGASSIMWSNATSHDDDASSVMWINSPQHNNGASSMVWSNTDQDIGASNMTSNINSKHDDGASSMMWSNTCHHDETSDKMWNDVKGTSCFFDSASSMWFSTYNHNENNVAYNNDDNASNNTHSSTRNQTSRRISKPEDKGRISIRKRSSSPEDCDGIFSCKRICPSNNDDRDSSKIGSDTSNQYAKVASNMWGMSCFADDGISSSTGSSASTQNARVPRGIRSGTSDQNARVSSAIKSGTSDQNATVSSGIRSGSSDQNATVSSGIRSGSSDQNARVSSAIKSGSSDQNATVSSGIRSGSSDQNARVPSGIRSGTSDQNARVSSAIRSGTSDQTFSYSSSGKSGTPNHDESSICTYSHGNNTSNGMWGTSCFVDDRVSAKTWVTSNQHCNRDSSSTHSTTYSRIPSRTWIGNTDPTKVTSTSVTSLTFSPGDEVKSKAGISQQSTPQKAGGLHHCPHCSHAEKYLNTLYTHIRKEHTGSLECGVCGRQYNSAQGLKQHMKNKH